MLRAANLVAGHTIGVFKCDLGTVYAAPGRYWLQLSNERINSYFILFI